MKRINLLPPEQRVKASRERGLLWAILLLVVVVAALGIVYMLQSNQVNAKQAELDAVTAQVAAEQAKAAALRPYEAIQAQRTAMATTAKGIYDARVSWSTILQEISLVIPNEVRLQTFNAVVPATMLPGAAVPAGPVPPSAADITFSGMTYTHGWVADFMTHLGLIPQLTNIQLASSSGSPATSTTPATVTFTVTASLRPYLTPPPATQSQGAAQ